MWHICTIEFDLAIKKNKIMSFSEKWMELKIMLNEIRRAQRDKYHAFSHTWNLDLGKKRHESRKCTVWKEEGDQQEGE
jgi:hypothetical protein